MSELQILEDKERLKSLKEMLHKFSAPADEALIERGGGRRRPMLCLRASLSSEARAGWRLPRAIQRRRDPARSVRICRRARL
jgi:hypothetical protein